MLELEIAVIVRMLIGREFYEDGKSLILPKVKSSLHAKTYSIAPTPTTRDISIRAHDPTGVVQHVK